MQHCSGSDQLLGKAPVWLSCIIFFVIGGVLGAIGGIVGMVFRTRKLHRAKHNANDLIYTTPYQSAAAPQVYVDVASALSHYKFQPTAYACQRLGDQHAGGSTAFHLRC